MPTISEIPSYKNPIPTTDVIIEYTQNSIEGLVLIERKNPPYGLAIPGGFHEFGLSAGLNAVKEAAEETGLEVIIEDENHPFCIRSSPDRDPRGHMITTVYVARGRGAIQPGSDAKTAAHYPIDRVIALVLTSGFVFDHGSIIKEYLVSRGYL
jgi:8-oxo-dGTP diphosphatase